VVVRLGDDEVDALVDGPPELLLVLRAHHGPGRLRVLRVIRPGVADVAGDERSALAGDLVGDADRLAVHLLEVAVTPDVLELLAVRVVGERDHDVGAGAEELAVQLPHGVGRVEDHLRHVRSRLHVSAAFQLEDVAFGADDDAFGEALLQGPLRRTAHRGRSSSKRAGSNRPMS
jgi:hypothetical protein